MFPKKQEPTNREAFTKVIGQQAHAHLPTWPICKQLNADAPKPPTYLFINSIFKERGHKTNNTPELRAYLPSCIQIPLQAFHPAPRQPRLHHCVASSSVRRYLGKPDSARKRKKHIHFHFSVTLNVYRGFSQLAPDPSAACKPPEVANSGKPPNLPP